MRETSGGGCMRSGSLWKGLGITFFIAGVAYFLANIPYVNIVGHLVIAILLGVFWKSTIGVKANVTPGIEYASSRLLRVGIILMGVRLDILDIYHAGFSVFFYAFVLLVSTLVIVYWLCRLLRVDRTVSILTACGTAICGAAAILAVAPILKSKEQSIGISIAIIALLGTACTIFYTLLFSWLPLSGDQFGVFAGGTLHEVAHVVAASSVGGEQAENMAIVVKLTRVALLVPVALVIMYWVNKRNKIVEKRKTPAIPWFLLGFVGMSLLNTLGVIPESMIKFCMISSYLFLAMAMAGLGLKMEVGILKKHGGNALLAGLIGSIILIVMGYSLIHLLPI